MVTYSKYHPINNNGKPTLLFRSNCHHIQKWHFCTDDGAFVNFLTQVIHCIYRACLKQQCVSLNHLHNTNIILHFATETCALKENSGVKWTWGVVKHDKYEPLLSSPPLFAPSIPKYSAFSWGFQQAHNAYCRGKGLLMPLSSAL